MGPPALGLAFQLYCKIEQGDSFRHSTPYICHDGHLLRLQSPDAFYGIGHDESALFFESRFNSSTVDKLKNSYVSHIYFHTKHTVPPNSLMAALARSYCPIVYRQALQDDF